MIKLFVRNWPRLILYIFLILLITGSVFFWIMSGRSSMSENFLAGAIEIAITVVLIDGLLSMERKRRIKVLNTGHARSSRYHLGLVLVELMKEFNFPVKPSELEVVGWSNEALRNKVSEFFESQEYDKYLQDVKGAKRGALKKVKHVEKLVERSASEVTKSLEKSEPYPDPILVKLINDAVPHLVALTKVVEIMFEMNKIVDDANGASDADLVKGILDKQMEELTSKDSSLPTTGIKSSSIHQSLKIFMDALLIVHERAEKNRLYYDI